MTKQEFREILNQRHPANETPHKNGKFQQKTRAYGDYLWYQDREQFEFEYKNELERRG